MLLSFRSRENALTNGEHPCRYDKWISENPLEGTCRLYPILINEAECFPQACAADIVAFL